MKTTMNHTRADCHKMVESRGCPVLEILRKAIREIEQQHRPAKTNNPRTKKEYLNHG